MKAKDLIKQLNETLTSRWVGKKFEELSEVHSDVRKIADTIIKPYGLECAMFHIRINDEYGTNLLRYTIEFNADKRFKYDTKGRVVKITFKTLLLDENATIEELKNEKKKQNAIENIERLENSQIELKKELEENEKYLKELKEELKTYA